MSRVLITHAYFIRFDPKQWGLQQAFPPLGTLYTAAVLREAGHTVSFFDVTFSEHAEEIIPILEREQPEILIICDDGFNYLTKMCLTNMRQAAFQMAGWGAKQGCSVIVSSSDATDHANEYLQQGADYIIYGETETSILELVNALDSSNKDVRNISGLIYQDQGTTVINPPREVLTHLDSLPLPAWDLVNMKAYRDLWMRRYGYYTINLATTRGCPYRCTWCAKPIFGYRYNSHSPEYILGQLNFLKQQYGFEKVWFCDDIFGLNKQWVLAFAKLIKEQQLHFSYKIQSRADLLLDEDYVKALAESGCDTVWLGAESGSQKILDAMNKGIQVAQLAQATALLRKHHINPAFFIQFGYPGETMEDIQMTLDMINQLLPEDIGISISYPLPGTLFYDAVKEDLQYKANWTDSDDLALMFKHTYSPAFYKRLHRYAHKNYRLHQGWDSLKTVLKNPARINRPLLRRILLIGYYFPMRILTKIRLERSSHA